MFVISVLNSYNENNGLYFSKIGEKIFGKDVISKHLCYARVYDTLKDAQNDLESILKFHIEEYSDSVYNCYYKPDGVLKCFDNFYKIIATDSIMEHESFKDAFPIDENHIPEKGRAVRLVPKDINNKKKQISGNFLYNEMKNGRFYLSQDGYNRWEYDEEEQKRLDQVFEVFGKEHDYRLL